MAHPPGPRLSGYIGYLPDARIDDILVDWKHGIHSFRNVRATLLELAYALTVDKTAKGAVILLLDSRITRPRLERELALARGALHPDVAQKIWIILEEEGRYPGLPSRLGRTFEAKLRKAVRLAAPAHRARYPQYTVLHLLIHQWLLDRGPMTTEWLVRASGSSYPTVAAALQRYEHVIARGSDRKVQLRRFPRDEWAEMVAMSDKYRSTERYADRSGQPRSPESLLGRLARRASPDVAVGGVNAGRFYDPRLDLRGTPRLDLSVAGAGASCEDLVKSLDPALERLESRSEPASVVVHHTQVKDSLFQQDPKGKLRYADPVETLLDLHEARLEPQASELLQFFVSRRKTRSPG